MPKTFYTERDIEDLVRQGVMSLVVDDDVVLTELAREKAERLGFELVREHDTPYSAPIRPYIAPESPSSSGGKKGSNPASKPSDLRERVLQAVRARLGDEVDPALLDTIVRRVLDSVGVS